MIALCATAMLAAAAPAAPPASVRPALLVVVHDQTATPVAGATLRRIANEVRQIWRPHVDLTFAGPDDATPPLHDDVLTLVITDRLSGGTSGDGLGWIEFVDGQPAKTISISKGGAVRLADQAVWAGRAVTEWPAIVRETFVMRALARSIAHEIGHYLLKSAAHEAHGLMRARFTVEDLMDDGLSRFTLLNADVQRLAQRFSSYRLARRGPTPETVQ